MEILLSIAAFFALFTVIFYLPLQLRKISNQLEDIKELLKQ
ncbi:hypothetical protein [Heliophilum fasciatum]|uniref:Uncharacterized protein n=1 Tax=Heliophilum fasciatum TaxID=35700 RepID=A0A4V2SW01_9FIRM|nr:hypothetical protein [Heliophilum fasciatum]MCW2279276.1 hypothetical protein [Heliophilum fasciatum]TCP60476.1 hypothetical protein EDD73_1364 [Heliophilum fasciatum]